jgi:hypothetical protein
MKHIIILLALAQLAIAQARAPEGAQRELVAAVILAESGGHGRKGMEAVYEVIHARATARRTTCAHEVLRRKQFSCLNREKPILLVLRMKRHRQWKWVHDELLKWVPITAHTGTNPYNRCRHYHAVSVTPYWAKGKRPFATFCGHKWYNNIK